MRSFVILGPIVVDRTKYSLVWIVYGDLRVIKDVILGDWYTVSSLVFYCYRATFFLHYNEFELV